MRWLKIVGGVAATAVAYVLIAGAVVPRTHVATVRATFSRPPAEVWSVLTDPAAQPSWRGDLESVEMLPPQDGRTVFREHGSFGPVRFIVDESQTERRYVVRILDEELGYGGRWIHELEPDGPGSRLTITEEGEVSGLFFRALSPFLSKTATLESFLTALGRKLGDTVTPDVVRSQ